jgi:phage gpG-like protein
MLKFEIQNRAEFLNALSKLKSDLPSALKRGLEKAVARIAADARGNVDSSLSRNSTGNLRSAVESGVMEEGGQLVGFVRVDEKKAPYASAHEFGAVIRPRRARYLAVPLPGTPRKPARAFPNTFVRMVNEKLFLFQKEGSGLRALFVLMKEVRIPARPFLQPALEKNRSAIRTMVEEEVQRAVADGGL